MPRVAGRTPRVPAGPTPAPTPAARTAPSILRLALALLALLLGGCAHLRRETPDWTRRLEEGRGKLHHGLVLLVRDVDRFFGDERVEEEYQDLRVAVANRFTLQEPLELDASVRLRGTLPLPILERKLTLFFGGDTEIDDPDSVKDAGREERNLESGLRFLTGDGPWTFKVNVGASWDNGPKVYVKPGIRYEIERETWDFRTTQYGIWDSKQGFGIISSNEYDLAVAPRWYFRSRTDLEYSETSHGVELGEALILRYRPNRKWAVSLQYHFQGSSRPAFRHDVSGMGVRFRSLLHFPWLEQEITPFLTFNRGRNYRPSPGLVFSLKIWIEKPDDG